MKLQFDAKQSYQIDAVDAVVDLFDGQPLNPPDYATLFQTFDTELFGSVGQTDLGIGNRLTLDGEAILKEAEKLRCGWKQFEAIGANYDVVASAEEV